MGYVRDTISAWWAALTAALPPGTCDVPPGTWTAVGKAVRGVLIVVLVAALYLELAIWAGPLGQGKGLDVVSLLASLPNLVGAHILRSFPSSLGLSVLCLLKLTTR